MAGIELTNSVHSSVLSSLLRVKDDDGLYYTVFPINTLHEVYYDMEKQITLEKFLEDKHLPQKVHHIEKLEDINNTKLTKDEVFIGDLIAVGGTTISNADYLYLVLDNTNFEDNTTLLELSVGSVTIKDFTLKASNWIVSDDFDGYTYIISDDINFPITDNINVEIDFASMNDIEKANDAEMQSYCDHGSDDGNGNSFIKLYTSFKPEEDINIIINFIKIRY